MLQYVEELEDTSDLDSEVSDESSGVEYDSDVDQDFDDNSFVESQSDVEDLVISLLKRLIPAKYVVWHSKALKLI